MYTIQIHLERLITRNLVWMMEMMEMMMETEKSYVVLSASGRPRIASGRVREGETYRIGNIGLHPGLQA